MTTIIANAAVRLIEKGILVSRATATLPQSATGHLFTVSGGRIMVTGLLGEVTTVIQGQATTLQLVATPTTGTAVNLNLVTASDINAKEVGAKITLDIPANKLIITNAGSNVLGPPAPVVVAIGTIDLTTVASSTGSVKWDLLYVPLDNGAQVVAA